MIKILHKKQLGNSICIVIGTRPGIVKMAPLYHEAKGRDIEVKLIHTGQHFSRSMDRSIMNDCDLPEPDFQIDVLENERTHARQTAKMMVGVENILLDQKPKIILVCGDANTNFAAAVAARKIHVGVGHVESGLRSYDWSMPEEHNRVMIDHISDYLFSPTAECTENLKKENVKGEIYTVGNTIVDATFRSLEKASGKSSVLEDLGLLSKEFVLLTAHREENVDSISRCKDFLSFIKKVKNAVKMPIIFPMHPRTEMRLKEYGLYEEFSKYITILEAANYLDFTCMVSNAHIVLTDSGGIQEESCILGVPCFTLRENTERWETLNVGSNYLCGFSFEKFLNGYGSMKTEWEIPYGDGTSAKKIIDVIAEK